GGRNDLLVVEHGEDQDLGRRDQPEDLLRGLDTVQADELVVHEDDVGLVLDARLDGLVARGHGADHLEGVVEAEHGSKRLGQHDVVLHDGDRDGRAWVRAGGRPHQSVLRTGILTMTWAPPSSQPSNQAPPPTRATMSLVSVSPRCTPPLPLPDGPRPLSRTLSSTESPCRWRQRSTC